MKGVNVTINPETEANTPYGLSYMAKGAYVQGKFIIVVGNLTLNNTIRVKYPAKDVEITLMKGL